MLNIIAEQLSQTAVSQFIQNILWIIPAVQTVHILAIAVVLSSVAMIDLRILGLAGKNQPMVEVADRFVPWLWVALVVLTISGATLVAGEPGRSLTNPAFQLKMAMLLCAIAVTATFQVTVHRNVRTWSASAGPGLGVRVFAVATFCLWIAIAVAGRWIAYIEVY